MKTVQELISELSIFPSDAEVKFYEAGYSGVHGCIETELVITEYDQDPDGNPTFLLEVKK